jgi:flavorubredoxin
MNVLLAHYSLGEVPKVIKKFEELCKTKNFNTNNYLIEVAELNVKKQAKKEKELKLLNPVSEIKNFDLVIVGTPIVSFSSVPAVNIFLRELKNVKGKNFCLFATGIGLPGKAIKKMSSILSMRGANIVSSNVFSSIFEFDEKKLKEVEKFFEELLKKI